MTETLVYVNRENEIARLILDRPEKRNAINLAMWQRIPLLVAKVESDSKIKVIIVQGRDDAVFAAGADLDEIGEVLASREASGRYVDAVHRAEDAIGTCSKPTLAMIQGHCVGGGLELAMACDLRFASTTSRFAIPPAKLGLVYSMASTCRLVSLVGVAKAKELLFSGRSFDAHEAAQIGLINQLFDPGEVVAQTNKYATTICRRSQSSVRVAKAIVQAVVDGDAAGNSEVRERIIDIFTGEDAKEGVAAYMQKRPPNFTGQ
ncbi:MAG: enoyl-CoA hydratase-related protein [Gammaproteobacteria bacterium]|nr:enoyl-CoA hydratase-related protein [Gammaproteobacteria bacterium]